MFCTHVFDEPLSTALCRVFAHKSVVDLGCGPGRYVRAFRQYGISCDGFDGNPHTLELSGGICQVMDLAMPQYPQNTYDWVLSLEVGEHIPMEFMETYMDNLDRYARSGIILSWATPGQGGDGHVNNQSNNFIEQKMANRGFSRRKDVEDSLRKAAEQPWFKSTIMVYERRPLA